MRAKNSNHIPIIFSISGGYKPTTAYDEKCKKNSATLNEQNSVICYLIYNYHKGILIHLHNSLSGSKFF